MSNDSAFFDELRALYTVEREIGRGGMATVYLAHEVRHRRPVALKVLRPERAAELGPERFLREIETAARLQHPHILPVFDSGESAGQLWFTMPYVDGESLRERLSADAAAPGRGRGAHRARGARRRSSTPTGRAWFIATSSPRTSS